MARICVFLAPGFEECEALIVVDVLRRGGVEVVTASIAEGLQVTSSHQVTVQADSMANQLNMEEFDGLFLPGGMPGMVNLSENAVVQQTIQQFAEQGKILAAICASPTIFASMGLLEGKQATCHPGFEHKLTGAQLLRQEFVQQGNILTGRAMGTTLPFGLHLLEMLQGTEAVEKVRSGICY